MQVSCKYLLNSLASIYCKINMQVSYLYLVPFLAHLLARCARKWPNYVQDSKISASCARLYIHTATFLARTRSASSCKVTQVYSTWAVRLRTRMHAGVISRRTVSGEHETAQGCLSPFELKGWLLYQHHAGAHKNAPEEATLTA